MLNCGPKAWRSDVVLPFSVASAIQDELDGSLSEFSQLLVLSKMQNCADWDGRRQH